MRRVHTWKTARTHTHTLNFRPVSCERVPNSGRECRTFVPNTGGKVWPFMLSSGTFMLGASNEREWGLEEDSPVAEMEPSRFT